MFIDTEKVILNQGETLNDLLICLICRGVVIGPSECSKCQRAYCNNCIKNLGEKKGSICKETSFNPPHIQTKRNLNQIKFYSSCCEAIINYSEINNHEQVCINSVQCKNNECKKKIYKENLEDHLKKCEFQNVSCNFCKFLFKINEISNHEKNCEKNNSNQQNPSNVIETNVEVMNFIPNFQNPDPNIESNSQHLDLNVRNQNNIFNFKFSNFYTTAVSLIL